MTMKLLLLGTLAIGLAAPLRAEDGPCKADMEKFCKDVKPGEGRIVKCMKEHEAELSEACKAHKPKAGAKEKHEDKKAGK